MGRKRYVIEAGDHEQALKVVRLLAYQSWNIKVEDVPPPGSVIMTSVHKFSQAIPANTIATITDFASKIAENGWRDLTFQTPWGKIVVFPKEPTPPAPEPLKPCPFCGGEPIETTEWNEDEASVERMVLCMRCGFSAMKRAAWNRRVTP